MKKEEITRKKLQFYETYEKCILYDKNKDKKDFLTNFFHSLNINLMDFRGSRSQIPDLTMSYFVFFRRTKKDGKGQNEDEKMTKKDEVRSSRGP